MFAAAYELRVKFLFDKQLYLKKGLCISWQYADKTEKGVLIYPSSSILTPNCPLQKFLDLHLYWFHAISMCYIVEKTLYDLIS